MKKTAIILGRFQNYRLHEGYEKLLDYADKNYDRVVIILGKAIRKSTDCDPLPTWVRKQIISQDVNLSLYQKLLILTIQDSKVDVEWCNKLDAMIESLDLESDDFHFLVGRDSFEPHYVGKHKTNFYTISEIPEVSSSNDRADVCINNIYSIKDFAKGIIYATQQPFPRVDPTVDVAIFVKRLNGDVELVVGRKPTEKQFRLPGGFVDGTDGSFKKSAVREALEETNIVVSQSQLNYVDSLNINDWRYRKGKDNAFTTLYTVYFDMTTPGVELDSIVYRLKDFAAGDDLAEVKYINIKDLHSDGLVPEHVILIDKALEDAKFRKFI